MQPEIVDVIRGGGLSRVAEELEQQRIHSIRLKAEVTPEAELELGVSKCGWCFNVVREVKNNADPSRSLVKA